MDLRDQGYIKISDFAHRVGKSIETIRAWDKSGKLKPAIKNGEKGHRFYTEEQVQQVLNSGAGRPAYNADFVHKLDQVLRMMKNVDTKVSGIESGDEAEEVFKPLSVRIQDVIEDVEALPESDDRDLSVIRMKEAFLMLKRSGAFNNDEDTDKDGQGKSEPVI